MAATPKKNAATANASVQRKKRSLVTVLTSALAVAAVCGVIIGALVFSGGEPSPSTATTLAEQNVRVNANANKAENAEESCQIQKCKAGGSEVCGTNGITYLNECFFQNARCKDPSINKVAGWKGYNCPHTCKKQIACNEVGVFLCASDGNVYFGYCNLYIAQCLNPSIKEVECDKSIFDGMFKRPTAD